MPEPAFRNGREIVARLAPLPSRAPHQSHVDSRTQLPAHSALSSHCPICKGMPLDSLLQMDRTLLYAIGGFLAGYLLATLNNKPATMALGKKALDGEGAEGAASDADLAAVKEEVKMVLIVRTDLKMSAGKAAAQCSHATLAAYRDVQQRAPLLMKKWLTHGQPKITLRIEDEASMMELYTRARSEGIPAHYIQDQGRTQIPSGSKTVLALGPAPKSHIDRISGHLKLY